MGNKQDGVSGLGFMLISFSCLLLEWLTCAVSSILLSSEFWKLSLVCLTLFWFLSALKIKNFCFYFFD